MAREVTTALAEVIQTMPHAHALIGDVASSSTGQAARVTEVHRAPQEFDTTAGNAAHNAPARASQRLSTEADKLDASVHLPHRLIHGADPSTWTPARTVLQIPVLRKTGAQPPTISQQYGETFSATW